MSATAFLPHEVRTTPQDLEVMARLWKWEGTIHRHLPRILASGEITILFQAIFDVRGEFPLLRAYEALARFPVARRVPTGLWFSVAAQMGLRMELELATARKALALIHRLPEETLLFVNSSPAVAPLLADEAPRDLGNRLVLDLPSTAIGDPHLGWVPDDLRRRGVAVALDDAPLSEQWLHQLEAQGAIPAYLQFDLASGAVGEEGWSKLSDAAEWCQDRQVILMAKRVERVTQLYALRDLGFHWAQGHSLARPTEI